MVIVIPRSEEQRKNVVNAAYEDIILVLKKQKREDLISKYDSYRTQLLSCTDKFAFERALNVFYKMSFYFQDQLGKRGKSKIQKIKGTKKSKKVNIQSEQKTQPEKTEATQSLQLGYTGFNSSTSTAMPVYFSTSNPIDPQIEQLRPSGNIEDILPIEQHDCTKSDLEKITQKEEVDINKEVGKLYDVYKNGFGLAYFLYRLPKTEIKSRVNSLIPILGQKYQFNDSKYDWVEDSRMSFLFKIKGQKISGSIYLFDKGLFIGGNLPFLARFYKKDIGQKMKQELDLIFEGCT